jgi:CheY-like chemotaxis protein
MVQPELVFFALEVKTAETVSTSGQQTDAPVEPDTQAETGLVSGFQTDGTNISDNYSQGAPNPEAPSGREEKVDPSSKQVPETEAEILAGSEAGTTTGRAITPEPPPEHAADGEASTDETIDRGLTLDRVAAHQSDLARPVEIDRPTTEAPEVQWKIEPGASIETNTGLPSISIPSVPKRPPKRRVLAIDDDPTMRKLLKMGLAPHNYDCVTAENGKAAQEVLKSYRPDLILVDLLMPVMDGLAFLNWLREVARDPTPVIVFTNVNDGEMTRAALRSGANSYASKPLHLKELLQAMQQLMPA